MDGVFPGPRPRWPIGGAARGAARGNAARRPPHAPRRGGARRARCAGRRAATGCGRPIPAAASPPDHAHARAGGAVPSLHAGARGRAPPRPRGCARNRAPPQRARHSAARAGAAAAAAARFLGRRRSRRARVGGGAARAVGRRATGGARGLRRRRLRQLPELPGPLGPGGGRDGGGRGGVVSTACGHMRCTPGAGPSRPRATSQLRAPLRPHPTNPFTPPPPGPHQAAVHQGRDAADQVRRRQPVGWARPAGRGPRRWPAPLRRRCVGRRPLLGV
jgi:hypothetical protein